MTPCERGRQSVANQLSRLVFATVERDLVFRREALEERGLTQADSAVLFRMKKSAL
jgi:hypothetical protein